MVCVCGHNKSEHLSGRDYGRNGWHCGHREITEDGSIRTCDTSCEMYDKKRKTVD